MIWSLTCTQELMLLCCLHVHPHPTPSPLGVNWIWEWPKMTIRGLLLSSNLVSSPPTSTLHGWDWAYYKEFFFSVNYAPKLTPNGHFWTFFICNWAISIWASNLASNSECYGYLQKRSKMTSLIETEPKPSPVVLSYLKTHLSTFSPILM